MTAWPLTTFEAHQVVNDYRVHVWPEHTMDVDDLVNILIGMPTPHTDVRHPVTQKVACDALDHHADTYGRPPTARELAEAIDVVTSDPARIATIIDEIRQDRGHPRPTPAPSGENTLARPDRNRPSSPTRRTA